MVATLFSGPGVGADKVEAVSELRGRMFAADSAVSSDKELVPPPKNSLILLTKKMKSRERGRENQNYSPVIVSSLISPNAMHQNRNKT